MEDFLKSAGIDLSLSRTIHSRLSNEQLISQALKRKVAEQTKAGSLVVKTGKHTGRAAKDKYIVESEATNKYVWWNKDVRKMPLADYQNIKVAVLEHLNSDQDLFVTDQSVGAHKKHNINVRVITPSPTHALFSKHLFMEVQKDFGQDDFTIYHAPLLNLDPQKFNLRSETCIVTNFEDKEVIILGTRYAGEIKKSMFSVMNYMLPFENILPMHSGANQNEQGEVSIFFGLSGTGKTTLSTDQGKKLIGDDEHGLSDEGIFNFEGGCYAKTYQLNREGEPEIFDAVNRPGALMENVVVHDGVPDFNDKSLSENGRASYPLDFIAERVTPSVGGIPKNIFFLSADAFGVLPPVAKLNLNQAMYYFLSGYTSKLAGTEIGVVEPEATFSACFGAPFMIQKPQVYASLLGHYLEKYKIQVWLINTGWHSGPYGEGSRFPLKVTRQIIRSIQNGKVNVDSTTKEPFFGLEIPNEVPQVESEILFPKKSWKDGQAYDHKAKALAEMFVKNMNSFEGIDSEVLSGGPQGLKTPNGARANL